MLTEVECSVLREHLPLLIATLQYRSYDGLSDVVLGPEHATRKHRHRAYTLKHLANRLSPDLRPYGPADFLTDCELRVLDRVMFAGAGLFRKKTLITLSDFYGVQRTAIRRLLQLDLIEFADGAEDNYTPLRIKRS